MFKVGNDIIDADYYKIKINAVGGGLLAEFYTDSGTTAFPDDLVDVRHICKESDVEKIEVVT